MFKGLVKVTFITPRPNFKYMYLKVIKDRQQSSATVLLWLQLNSYCVFVPKVP